AHPQRGGRAVPGHLGHFQRRRRRRDAQEVGVVLLVRRQDVHVYLDLVLEPFREERPDRTVDHPGRKDLLVRGTTLALQEAAGDLARGVALFAIFDGEGEEGEGRNVVRHGQDRKSVV